MKKVLLLGVLSWGVGVNSYANDTLTRAQVYNFNVGDTFDYQHSQESTYPWQRFNYYTFTRYVIENIITAPDTLFIARKEISGLQPVRDTVAINDLDSLEVLRYYLDANNARHIQRDSNSLYNGRIQNKVSFITLGFGSSHTFVEGLGIASVDTGGGDGMGNYSTKSTSLIYYSKLGETYGVPYTVLNGSSLIHFTPLAEECAVWTKEIRTPGSPPSLRIQEQIRTGNRIPLNGHAYVELIYRGYDFLNNDNHIDSLIGYFRNDTLNRLVWFRNTLTGPDSLLYDFNLLNGAAVGASQITLSQISINGTLRTQWNYQYGIYPKSYVEGIGDLSGVISLKFLQGSFPHGNNYGQLTCFSVCGKTLYPNDTLADCALINTVEEIFKPQFYISPNPATTSVTINIDETMIGSMATITDVTGRKIEAVQLATRNLQLATDNFPNGVYFVSVGNEKQSTTRKLVVSR